jgi:dipeptidyl aminopeptidase/acylaminoacyl peptidase
MRMRSITLLLPLCFLATCAALDTTPTVVNQEACPSKRLQYEEFVARSRAGYEQEVQSAAKIGVNMPAPDDFMMVFPSRETYEQRLTHSGFECIRITYLSEGLKVIGFIFKPADTKVKRLPAIIYNRGGSREFAKIVPNGIFLWDYDFLAEGFVILASQYRGSDGGDGKDEFGGRDLNDVSSLLSLAQTLDYVDGKNIFMYGFSRGGVMTYLALKNNFAVKAAAVSAGPTDLAALGRLRPEIAKNYSEMIPDYGNDPTGTLNERSAIAWPEKINTPLLLLHGTSDWRVPTAQTLDLASRLQQLHKTYALEIFANDTHGVPMHNEEAHRRVIEWFRAYIR